MESSGLTHTTWPTRLGMSGSLWRSTLFDFLGGTFPPQPQQERVGPHQRAEGQEAHDGGQAQAIGQRDPQGRDGDEQQQLYQEGRLFQGGSPDVAASIGGGRGRRGRRRR